MTIFIAVRQIQSLDCIRWIAFTGLQPLDCSHWIPVDAEFLVASEWSIVIEITAMLACLESPHLSLSLPIMDTISRERETNCTFR